MGIRRVGVRALVLCAVGVMFATWCGVASAKLVHPFVSSFGSFSNVQGVATDAAGNVYVYDGGAGKVFKFDASGKPANFTSTATNSISNVGVVSEVEGEIAVDNSSGPAKGDIYTADKFNSIKVYGSDGSKLGELEVFKEVCGVAVDSSGNVYAGAYPEEVKKYSPTTNLVTKANFVASMVGLNEVCNVAADSAGDVFVDKWTAGPVTRYEPSQFGALSATGSVVDGKGSTVAVDSASDEVYVDEKGQVAQFGPKGEPFEAPLATFANAGEGAISGSTGIAVSSANHDIYVSDGKGHISVFGPGVTFPTVTTGEASDIGNAQATVSGGVNPEGATITTCQFEYGATVAYGQTVPCPTSIGSGDTQIEEAVVLSGLESGTEYHYRLVVSTASGSSTGADRTFTTSILWPETINGLPDARLYELVTPTDKYGGEVLNEGPAFVAQDGQSVMYTANGAVAEESTNNSIQSVFVSQRASSGWVTRQSVPLPVAGEKDEETYLGPSDYLTWTVPSSDLSHLLFSAQGRVPYVGPPDEAELGNNIYLEGPDPFAEPVWVGRSQIEGQAGASAHLQVAGTSPDLKTIYFYFGAPLLQGASGLYEYKDGVLSDVGVLPQGETGIGDAYPAADPEGTGRVSASSLDNQVAVDGSRIFFTRKDEAGEVELYVRVTAPDGSQSTMLVSRSQLAGHVGDPAPHGPLAVPSTEWRPIDTVLEGKSEQASPGYVFASPAGNRAFFQSTDRLTEAAPENALAKSYVFDLETGTLEYLPWLTGSIVTTGDDGSWLIFENTAASPFRLERWAAGVGGGTVTPIAPLPSPSLGGTCGAVVCVGPVNTSSDGSVVTFTTESPIVGFNDGGTHHARRWFSQGEGSLPEQYPNSQVFRYDATTSVLDCISCPPNGVKPSSNATISKLNNVLKADYIGSPDGISTGRGMSSDGKRVFFETRDGLVPQDTNGTGDVYEWENGKIYLISSGHSQQPSYFVGIGESGEDAYFTTTEGIVPGDRDGSFDVYDARIPRPGDRPAPEAVPCTGAVCQGPPSVPNLLGQPASEAFSGAENLPLASSSDGVKSKSLTRAQKLARSLKACKRRKSARGRKRCEHEARRKYGGKAAVVRREAKQARHRNGRGK